MSTITISLPDPLANRVDSESIARGFATRSEFFRDLLRKYFQGNLKLEAYQKPSLDEVQRDLKNTGKYRQEFIDSIIAGLKKSSLYAG